jgi:hypothetical protein
VPRARSGAAILFLSVEEPAVLFLSVEEPRIGDVKEPVVLNVGGTMPDTSSSSSSYDNTRRSS